MPVERYTATLSDGRKVVVESDHPPSEAEILAVVGGTGSAAGPRGMGTPPAAGNPSAGTTPRDRDWLDTAASWLPTAGSAAGAILGGAGGLFGAGVGAVPGSALGAAGGGALGKTLEKTINEYRHPEEQNLISLGTLADIGTEGVVQGGLDLVGGALTRGAVKGGTALYRKMLRPNISARLAPRAAEIVQTGIRENVNPFNLHQVEGLEPTISDIGDQVALVGHGTPGTINPAQTAARTRRVINKFAGPGADPADRAAAASVPRNFLDDATETVSQRFSRPAQTLEGHEYSTLQSRPLQRARPMDWDAVQQARRSTGASAGGNSFGITRGAETEARKELYHELGTDLGTLNPEVRPLMNRERQLIDLKDAATAAYNRGANTNWVSLRHLAPFGVGIGTGAVAGLPAGALATGGALALTNPRVITKAALMAARARRHGVLSQAPRMLFGGYHALTAGDRPDDAGY